MMQAPARERVGQGGDDVLLPRQLGKRPGPPLAGKNLVGHSALKSKASERLRREKARSEA